MNYFKFYRQVLRIEGVVVTLGILMVFLAFAGAIVLSMIMGFLGFFLNLAVVMLVYLPFGAWLFKNMFEEYEYKAWRFPDKYDGRRY